MSTLLTIALSTIMSLVAIAFIEYAGHRWFLHRQFTFGKDHLQHHKLFTMRFTGIEEVPEWYDRTWIRVAMALAWSSLFMAPICIWLSLSAGLTFVTAAALHAGAWFWVHDQMHRPTCGWFVRSRYFRFISRFHETHHRYPRSNFAFLFAPFFDQLLGTYRPESG